jgi:hypothetical protein
MTQTLQKPAPRSNSSEQVEPITIDCDHIMTYAGGDSGQLIQLCASFLSELPVHMLALRNALKRRELLAAKRAVQHLSSCLIVFGSSPLTFTLESLTAALRYDRIKQARSEWQRLQYQLDLLVPQVQRLMLEAANPRGSVQ